MLDKVEGVISEHDSSSRGEGIFSHGIDSQIQGIEKQLEKAQSTLMELQSLKDKLESERQKNLEKIKKEKEAIEIKEENKRLKTELSSYQSEISSLKKVISSLKEDLISSTEHLQSKVNNSLKILEEASTSLEAKEKSVHSHTHHKKPETNFSLTDTDKADDTPTMSVGPDNYSKLAEPETKPEPVIEKINNETETTNDIAGNKTDVNNEVAPSNPVSADNTTATTPVLENTQPQVAAIEPEQSTEIKTETENPSGSTNLASIVSDKRVEQENADQNPIEEQPSVPAPTETGATAEPDLKPAPVVEEVANKDENTSGTETVTTEVTQPAQASTTEANRMTEGELKEADLEDYQQITQELEELEESSIFHADEQTPEIQATDQPVKQVSKEKTEDKKAERKIESSPKKFLLLFKKKPKVDNVTAALNNLKQAESEKAEPEKQDQPVVAQSSKEEKGKSGNGLAVKASIIIFAILIGGVTYRIVNADKLKDVYITQAKNSGAYSSQTSSSEASQLGDDSPEARYKEAFADVPFDQTVWSTYKDEDFGVSIAYPSNTSYRLKQVQSNNLWFLRKGGYLFTVEKLDPNTTIEQAEATITKTVNYTTENVEFKGLPAVHFVPVDTLPVKGELYLVNNNNIWYKVWYKTYEDGQDSDDAQRVTKMLESLTFIQSVDTNSN